MKNRFVVNEPIIVVDQKKLKKEEVSKQELGRYLPRYILNPTLLYYGRIKKIWFSVVQCFLRAIVKIFLRPRRTPVGNLDLSEVDEVYTREAANYNWKHHLTTRGMDLVWRRAMGWFIATVGRNKMGSLKILDLCTGTGLVIKEVLPILAEWDIDVEIIGLDCNTEMLAIAKKNISITDKIKFVGGDATNLTGVFDQNSIDIITQMLGIGGISDPLKVFDGVLRILKPRGQFLMIDMHKPIPEQPGEWPFLLRWCHFPTFEVATYEQSTIPLVLNRLWAWRDATASFYLLPLISYQDSDDRYWGFRVQGFEQETQRWWFALPLMPIAKVIVEKIEIGEEVANTRRAILDSCSFKQK